MGPPPARSGLTEGRILARRLTERRSLRLPRRAECAFPLHHRPGGVGRNPPPACGALWRMAQLGKRARTIPRQAAGGCAGARRPQPGAWPRRKAQSGQGASLMARPGPSRDTIRLSVVGYGGAGNSGLVATKCALVTRTSSTRKISSQSSVSCTALLPTSWVAPPFLG